jgi:uncharacterized membrane protein (DUF441 family)
MTAPVQPGNSGGPLIGLNNGTVVGVVSGKLNALKIAETTGDIPQNINFAVSLGIVQSFLNTHGVPYLIDDTSSNKTYADIAAEGCGTRCCLSAADEESTVSGLSAAGAIFMFGSSAYPA